MDIKDLEDRIEDLKLGLETGLGIFDINDKDCIASHIESAEFYLKRGDLSTATKHVLVAQVAENESSSSKDYLIFCNLHGIRPIISRED